MDLRSRVKHTVIRARVALHQLELRGMSVRVPWTAQEHRDALDLLTLADAEGESEYEALQARHRSVVLGVYQQGRLLAAVRVFRDSEAGLPLDRECARELDPLRQAGAFVIELGPISLAAAAAPSAAVGVAALALLAAQRVATHLGATHIVTSGPARLRDAWCALFGFRPCRRQTEGATTSGVVIACDELPVFLRKHHRKPLPRGTMLWEYFAGRPLREVDLSRESLGALLRPATATEQAGVTDALDVAHAIAARKALAELRGVARRRVAVVAAPLGASA